jgi:hypothetical protein
MKYEERKSNSLRMAIMSLAMPLTKALNANLILSLKLANPGLDDM